MPPDLLHEFRVGPWKIEPLRGAVTDPDGKAQHLEPKVMDVFVCLAEHANELVTRDQLLETVWSGHAAADELLTRAISDLRHALQDDRGDPKYIETVPKRGYRLIGEVRLADGSPAQSATKASRFFKRPVATLGAVGLVAIVVLYIVFDKGVMTGETTSTFEAEKSIAVLAFADLSPEGDQEYFSDGISEEILNALTTIQGLKVTSRTSSFSFKGKDVPIPEVAEILGVAHILEGSVRKSGDRLRIAAQLIEVSGDRHLWSNTWERTLTDVFAIQDEIAAAVVESLRVKLLGELPKAQRTDPEAYSLLLQAKVPARTTTKEGNAEAIRLLTQALAIDPEYAAGWAALAIVQAEQALDWHLPPKKSYARAEASARRALSLDPNNDAAMVVLGVVEMYLRWDFEEAGKWFHKARKVAPGHSMPRNALAIWTGNLGQAEAALALYQEAVDRDPLSPQVLGNFVGANTNAGRFDIARSQIEAGKQIAPESNYITARAALLEYHQGNFEDALRYADQLESPNQFLRACAFHSLGRFSEAEAELEGLRQLETPGASVAGVYACWDEEEKAFEWLDRAYEEHDQGLTSLRTKPEFQILHHDPRWEALLQKVGISDEHAEKLGL
jgi:TolB-like protein/DNA-binding winged helix-turn-helix (wHTH) protein/Tfp pilus assembly protein PilF